MACPSHWLRLGLLGVELKLGANQMIFPFVDINIWGCYNIYIYIYILYIDNQTYILRIIDIHIHINNQKHTHTYIYIISHKHPTHLPSIFPPPRLQGVGVPPRSGAARSAWRRATGWLGSTGFWPQKTLGKSWEIHRKSWEKMGKT